MNNDLSKALDLAPIPKSIKESRQVPAVVLEEDKDVVTETKSELDDLIGIGKDAVDELSAIASSSQEPKAYDSLGKMMKIVADIQMKKFAVTTGKKTDREGDIVDPPTVNNTTQNLFVGSTEDFRKMLNNEGK